MGTWGHEPWENDAAADWCDELLAATALDDHISRTLQLDPELHRDEIRAAVFVLTQLGDIFAWRTESFESLLMIAEQKLTLILSITESISDLEYKFLKEAVEAQLSNVRRCLEQISRPQS